MDLAVLVILIVVAIIVFRDIKWVVMSIGTIEIFLRLVNYIGNNIGVEKVADFVNRIFPKSIFSVIDTYSSGILNEIISWILVGTLLWFLIYLIIYLFKRG